METITFDATGQNGIIVLDGRAKKARLKWTADTLEIYLLGSVTKQNRDALNHMAMQACLSRHISIFALRVVQPKRRVTREIITSEFLRGLFDDLVSSGYIDYRFDCNMCGKPCMSVDDNGHCSSCRQIWEGKK